MPYRAIGLAKPGVDVALIRVSILTPARNPLRPARRPARGRRDLVRRRCDQTIECVSTPVALLPVCCRFALRDHGCPPFLRRDSSPRRPGLWDCGGPHSGVAVLQNIGIFPATAEMPAMSVRSARLGQRGHHGGRSAVQVPMLRASLVLLQGSGPHPRQRESDSRNAQTALAQNQRNLDTGPALAAMASWNMHWLADV